MEFLTDPWGWWITPFADNQFMRDALLAGILTVITTSLVGTWVVLRGMSFLGDALAHGVLPGIAVAFIIGVNTSIGAFVAAGAMVLGISVIRRHSPLPDDTSIGVLFVGFLALAVVIMSTQQASYVGDLNRFLFGSITGVDDADLVRQAIAALIALVGVVVLYRAFLVMTFDASLARMLGLRPGFAQWALLVLLAVSIVSSFESVGNLLGVRVPDRAAGGGHAHRPTRSRHHGRLGAARELRNGGRHPDQLSLRQRNERNHGVVLGGAVLRRPGRVGRVTKPAAERNGVASGSAVGATAVEVDRVMRRGEPLGARHRGERFVEAHLELRRQGHVTNRPAQLTDQVMVMLGQVLGQLVPGVVGAVDQSAHHADLFEDRQVAVGRTLGEGRGQLDQLRQRDRPIGARQRVDDGASARRVALVVLVETITHRSVDLGMRRRHRSPAQPRYPLVIGNRRSLPKALRLTRTPGGDWRRLYSATSTSRVIRRTIASSWPSSMISAAVRSSST